ncbi:MAG: lipid-A-disaccharide synthase [Paludibacteraceae bacterium]|nr:lipid-A-disaccharide synthase [Paludibacteraceae bacterium]
MKYFLLAGEASGDLHASNLIRALQQEDAEATFVGLGGDKMCDAGCRLLQHYRNMAFMGVIAVLANLKKIRENFRIAEQGLLDERPDVLVLIDYPSFNLKIAQFCKTNLPQTKIVYYIPPKVWAWKTFRIHKIARLSDLVLGIFPFESTFYAKYGYCCEYVGNPTMDSIREYQSSSINQQSAISNQQSPITNIIALLPGSRRSEIKHCLPTMLAAAREVLRSAESATCNLQPVTCNLSPATCHLQPLTTITVAAAPGIEDSFYAPYLQGEQLTRDTYQLVTHAKAAIVNSGTATLETALLNCPQTAVYYIACSKWLGWLKPFIFKIPFFTLVNIVPAREVIKELIAFNFTKAKIVTELTRLLTDEPYRQQMLADYDEIRSILGCYPAAATAAKRIVSLK